MDDNPYQSPLTHGGSAPPDRSGVAIASFVLGFFSLIACCLPLFGIPLSIVGVVLGIFGRSSSNRALAIAGIVLNSFGLCLSLANAALGAWMIFNGGVFPLRDFRR